MEGLEGRKLNKVVSYMKHLTSKDSLILKDVVISPGKIDQPKLKWKAGQAFETFTKLGLGFGNSIDKKADKKCDSQIVVLINKNREKKKKKEVLKQNTTDTTTVEESNFIKKNLNEVVVRNEKDYMNVNIRPDLKFCPPRRIEQEQGSKYSNEGKQEVDISDKQNNKQDFNSFRKPYEVANTTTTSNLRSNVQNLNEENSRKHNYTIETTTIGQVQNGKRSLFEATIPISNPISSFNNNSNNLFRNPSISSSTSNSTNTNEIVKPQSNKPIDEVKSHGFTTAYKQLVISDRAKGIKRNLPTPSEPQPHVSGLKKITHSVLENNQNQGEKSKKAYDDDKPKNEELEKLLTHDLLKNVDPKMVEAVLNEAVEVTQTRWNDIAGLNDVKRILNEIVVWPILRPDVFYGLRGPPKGILLFGPPGTGKTMIGRMVATESKSNFFNISASSLTSKWIGDGEKMVKALFLVARIKQPSVIFIDEIDSILTSRSETEHESSRRLKTEFLVQFDGCGTNSEDRVLVIGVTNRPQELDDAARRRLTKRIYIPLPDMDARKQLVGNLMKGQKSDLTKEDYNKISEQTDGFSGADMASLCKEAAYGPIRELFNVNEDEMIEEIDSEQVRGMRLIDFINAKRQVKASVAQSDLEVYKDWNDKFGCQSIEKSSFDIIA